MLFEAPAPPLEGPFRSIRYGYMPNRLRYGGGDDGSNRTLFEYAAEGVSDGGLVPLLRRFTGALPYLQLISHANAIADPFDPRVVEAHWLGNELRDRVEVRPLYDALLERLGKQLTGRIRQRYCSRRCAAQAARSAHAQSVRWTAPVGGGSVVGADGGGDA